MSKVTSQTAKPAVPAINGSMRCSPAFLNRLLGVATGEESDDPAFTQRAVKAGHHLIRSGQDYESLYVVNAGFFKTVYTDDCGNEQVLGFPVKGDVLGTDGIGGDVHVNEVVALTDATVVVIPFRFLNELSSLAPGLDETMFRIISQQLIQEQLALTAIGALCAESRLARFLIRLAEQMKRQGYSDSQFNLRMNRQDMGSYLAMKIETVSRTLTNLAKKGMIAINQREVTILDRAGLGELSRHSPGAGDALMARPSASRATITKAGKSAGITEARAATPWSGLTDSIDEPVLSSPI